MNNVYHFNENFRLTKKLEILVMAIPQEGGNAVQITIKISSLAEQFTTGANFLQR